MQIPCVVPVVPGSATAASTAPTTGTLNAWRGLLLHAKTADCEVSEPIAKVRLRSANATDATSQLIEADWVGMRQKSATASQETLMMRVTVARLVAISRGLTALDEHSWRHAVELDERRLSRLAASRPAAV